MNELFLEFPIKPMSLNGAYIIFKGRRIPSKAYVKFKREIAACLAPHTCHLKAFFSAYNPTESEIHTTLVAYCTDLYTVKKTINQKSGDIDNMHKCLSDLIFKTQNKVDDSAIVSINIKKVYSKIVKTTLLLEIKPRI